MAASLGKWQQFALWRPVADFLPLSPILPLSASLPPTLGYSAGSPNSRDLSRLLHLGWTLPLGRPPRARRVGSLHLFRDRMVRLRVSS